MLTIVRAQFHLFPARKFQAGNFKDCTARTQILQAHFRSLSNILKGNPVIKAFRNSSLVRTCFGIKICTRRH